MGFLSGVTLPPFTSATISIWFRMPAATYNALYALTPEFVAGQADGFSEINGFYPAFYKCLPLISFGSIETAFSYASSVACQPSFIGIDFSGIQANSPGQYFNGKTGGTLCCNLQTPDTLSFNKSPSHPEVVVRPECYYMSGVGGVGAQALALPDKWHHALISFDISPSSNIIYYSVDPISGLYPVPAWLVTQGPRFTMALDDHPHVDDGCAGSSLANAYRDAGQSAIDKSYILSSGVVNANQGDQNLPFVAPTDFQVTLSAGEIAAGTVSIPTNVSGSVYNIEMAELQFYTGIFMDVRDTTNRRLFVTDTGRPASVSVSTTALGKTPEIYLGKKSSNWTSGKNLGTAGNFTPGGTISPYSPGPALG